jgi:hypothetical protein
MKRLLTCLGMVLLGVNSASANDFSFSDFIGNYEITHCAQRENHTNVTGFCDAQFNELAMKMHPDFSYSLSFEDSSGNTTELPALRTERFEAGDFLETAEFNGTPNGASWVYRKFNKATDTVLISESYSWLQSSEGLPILVHTTYNGLARPSIETRQYFHLQRLTGN